jgi:hypothetical protein
MFTWSKHGYKNEGKGYKELSSQDSVDFQDKLLSICFTLQPWDTI